MAKSTTSTIFANPRSITAWKAEAKRVSRKVAQTSTTQNSIHLHNGLALLDEIYCKKNPSQKNPLQVRQTVFSMFLNSSMTGDPLGMFFEGLARIIGFGCAQDLTTGRALIQVSASRQCAEALNYLGLCYCKQDVLVSLQLLRMAAQDGHQIAGTNFRLLAEQVRIQIRRRRKIVEFTSQPRARLIL